MENSMRKQKDKTEKIFAQGFCYDKLFFVFLIGGIAGTYYEEILHFIKVLFKYGRVEWVARQGVIYGPFNPVYAIGLLLMVICLSRKPKKWYITLFHGALIGGGFEYLLSFLQEKVVGSTSWDYSHHFLNINGRTTLPFMLFWGLLSLIFVHYVYPPLSRWIEKIPYSLGKSLTLILSIFLAFDMAISLVAVVRQNLRRSNIPPYSIIGRYCDSVYPDEFLEQVFPNMVYKD